MKKKCISISVVMMILIMTSQLFGTKNWNGINGAVTQPTGFVSPGNLLDINTNYFSGDVGGYLNFLDEGKGLLSTTITGTAKEGFEISFMFSQRGLSLNYGANTKVQLPLPIENLTAAVGGGFTLYDYDKNYSMKWFSTDGLQSKYGNIYYYNYYGALSYLFSDDLSVSFNMAHHGVNVNLKEADSISDNKTSYGCAVNYSIDKFDVAADYMKHAAENDYSSLGLKVGYNIDRRWSASVGMINENYGKEYESTSSLFGSVGFKFVK